VVNIDLFRRSSGDFAVGSHKIVSPHAVATCNAPPAPTHPEFLAGQRSLAQPAV